MENKKVKGIVPIGSVPFLCSQVGGFMLEGALVLYKVNPDYCDYLRKYDHRVPMNRDDKDRRPFVGIVLEISGINYYASLSSPKEKHLNMSNQQDFLKINNGHWGAINFNNMIPINQKDLIKLDLSINQEDAEEEIKYKNLLENQRRWCNNEAEKIRKKAQKLHTVITSGKCNNPSLVNRCCDFSLLEKKYIDYCQINNLSIQQLSVPSLDQLIKNASKGI